MYVYILDGMGLLPLCGIFYFTPFQNILVFCSWLNIQLNAGYWCNFYWVKNAVPYPLILILSSPFGQFPPRYERLRPQAPPRILNPHYDPSGTHYDWLLPPQLSSSSSPWGCGSNLHVDDVQLIWCVMMGKLQEVDPFPRLIGGQGHSGIVCKNYPRFEQWRWRWLTKGGSPDEKDMVGHEVGHVVSREVSQTMWWEKRYHQSITNDPVLQNGQKAGQ